MKSFFDHPYYRFNKMFLSHIGTWPEQSLFLRCLLPFIVWATFMTVMIPEINRLPSVRHDPDIIMDCIPPFLVMTVSFVQLFNGSFNRKTIQKMINHIPEDWKRLSDSPSIDIIHKYAARGCWITKAYAVYVYGSVIFYLSMPTLPVVLDIVAPLNESREKIYLFVTDYGVDADKYYWPILFHSWVTTILSMVTLVANDTMLFVMIEHACALFEIVGVNLKMVDNGNTGIDKYRMICRCINLHKEAIIFTQLIEASYCGSLVSVVGCCTLILSITGVQTIINFGKPEQMLRYGSFALAEIVHIYLNSVPGQKIIDYSLSVYDYAYAINWYELTPQAQKLLILIMLRSARPCQITAGKIYIVSMENYSSVMRTSMSYFTVFSSMR